MDRLFVNAVALSHQIVAKAVGRGDRVVDATVGNGGDTVFLAGLVGPQGLVTGFDIQQEALNQAGERLREAGLMSRVKLINAGHENLEQYIAQPIKACMFNLGYLPGRDHRIITLPETTKAAVEQATKLLEVNGIIALVVYTGHQGGAEEAAAVAELVQVLPQELWDVAVVTFPNRRNNSPYLVAIQRR